MSDKSGCFSDSEYPVRNCLSLAVIPQKRMAFLRFTEQFRNNLLNGLSHPLCTARDVLGSLKQIYDIFLSTGWFLPLALFFWHHLCVLLVTLSLGCTEQLCHGAHSWSSHCSQLWHGHWALHKAASWELRTRKGFFSVELSYQHWQQQQTGWGFINFINFIFSFFFSCCCLDKM